MKTEKHREIYPLPFDKISKQSSFEQILGRKITDYSEQERKDRWEKAFLFKGGKKIKDYYSNLHECSDCIHFQNGWCAFASLPCGVNPVLTFQYGHLGLACQGAGRVEVGQQELQLNDTDDDLPF
jgi:hypothetical protein